MDLPGLQSPNDFCWKDATLEKERLRYRAEELERQEQVLKVKTPVLTYGNHFNDRHSCCLDRCCHLNHDRFPATRCCCGEGAGNQGHPCPPIISRNLTGPFSTNDGSWPRRTVPVALVSPGRCQGCVYKCTFDRQRGVEGCSERIDRSKHAEGSRCHSRSNQRGNQIGNDGK